jgi:hypothetical protein
LKQHGSVCQQPGNDTNDADSMVNCGSPGIPDGSENLFDCFGKEFGKYYQEHNMLHFDPTTIQIN